MAGNKRNTRTTHPKQSARRLRVLQRIAPTTRLGDSNAEVINTLAARLDKQPRAWRRA